MIGLATTTGDRPPLPPWRHGEGSVALRGRAQRAWPSGSPSINAPTWTQPVCVRFRRRRSTSGAIARARHFSTCFPSL